MNNLDSKPQIEFARSHPVELKAGDYEITATQEIKVDGEAKEAYTKTQKFSICSERFELNPQTIAAVFPPPGSRGDFSNVLPHVLLNRSTLPWERTAEAGSELPWLALLLFHEDELYQVETNTISLQQMMESKSGLMPTIRKEVGQHDDDQIVVIDVPKGTLEKLLPDNAPQDGDETEIYHELDYLAHVRRRFEQTTEKEPTTETAAVLSNRLPQKGHRNVAHLVSLEGRYQGKTFKYTNKEKIRLVSLKSWSFFCQDPNKTFTELLKALDQKATFSLPLPEDSSPATDAHKYLSAGFIPLPHHIREGSKTVSWYHGPLVPQQMGLPKGALPARSADAMTLYDQNSQMLDVSYASAWQLGRLLTLQNQGVALKLFNWKRGHRQSVLEGQRLVDYLPCQPSGQSLLPDFPEEVNKWFEDLSCLKPIPFNYLVPDERLLPPESIRYFRVDADWVSSLRDGAFSVGRVLTNDQERDKEHIENGKPASSKGPVCMSGILIRSEVVSGWPNLQVNGYSHKPGKDSQSSIKDQINILLSEKRSKDILLCLFDGEAKTVDVHLKPEMLHFGFDQVGEKRFEKKLRDNKGNETEVTIDVDTFKDKDSKVIDMIALASKIKTSSGQESFTPADFAMQMVEGTELVRFSVGGD